MAGVFAKARLAALSVVHNVLDKVIDLNSVEAVKQHIRDLETSRDQLSDSVAEARGHVTGVSREVTQLTAKQSTLNLKIDDLLTDNDKSNDHHANTLEAELVGVEELLTLKQEELNSAKETVQALDQAYSALNTKLTTMVQQLSRLEALDRSAGAKEKAATAMRHAAQASASGTEVSVDSVASRIQRRADVADEKFKTAMGTFATAAEENTAMATVAARLANRKKKLAATTASSPSATSY